LVARALHEHHRERAPECHGNDRPLSRVS
jgi:hypothetical protein